jgi:hypothetical protein
MALKRIPIYCQECHNVDIFSDYGVFFLFLKRKWDLIWQHMSPQDQYTASLSKVVGRLTLDEDIASPKKLIKHLKQNEFITYVCRDCFAYHTEQWYKANGYPNAVRYGRVITDKDYVGQHREEVYNLQMEMNR